MARTVINGEKLPGTRYSLNITCICGGEFIPFTHNISDTGVTGYRCNRCGKDIISKSNNMNKNNNK